MRMTDNRRHDLPDARRYDYRNSIDILKERGKAAQGELGSRSSRRELYNPERSHK